MDAYDLIEELSSKPKEEIRYALLTLMLKDKIDFVDLNSAYVSYLNAIKEDRLNQLIEAEKCVHESFFFKKGDKTDADMKHTQRCLYLLNNSNRFNLKTLNEKYKYDEEKGKELSWYERQKNDKL